MNPLFITSTAFATTSLALAIATPIYGRQKYHQLWAAFNMCVALWGFGLATISLLSAEAMASAIWRLTTIPGTFISCFFCHFVLSYRKRRANLLLVSTYVFMIVYNILNCAGYVSYALTNLHGFYYVRSATPLFVVMTLAWCSCAAYAFWTLLLALRNTAGEELVQIKYLITGTSIGFITGALSHWLPAYGYDLHPSWNLFITAYVLMVTFAMFRHRLMGFEPALVRGATYTVTTSLVTCVYVLGLVVVEKLFRRSFANLSVAWAFVTFALIVAATEPLRLRIYGWIDKAFFKGSIAALDRERSELLKHVERQERTRMAAALAAGMAHEIKNPLTAIKTFAEYLPDKYDDDNFRLLFSSTVQREIGRIDTVVRDLLSFARPSDPVFAEADINAVLKDTLGLLQNDLDRLRIKTNIALSGDLPKIRVDANQIKQVFLNILLNAMEVMQNGGELSVQTLKEDHRIVLIVDDTGPGMTKQQLSKAGEPFYSTKAGGTGLGLSIVQAILDKHGGKFMLSNRPDRVGARAVITL